MKVVVLGSGVIGMSTAWWLRDAGYDVVVMDRETGPAQGASRATGGHLSIACAEPWARPAMPLQLFKWQFMADPPIIVRPRADRRLWSWSLAFLRECLPPRMYKNVQSLVRLSAYSLKTLRQMRSELHIDDDHLACGVLNVYRSAADFDKSQDMAGIMRELGVDRRILTPAEMIALEPGLAAAKAQFVGGDYAADDESGDAWAFTRALEERARKRGVEFLYSSLASRLIAQNGRVTAVQYLASDGSYRELAADVFVVALGACSAALLRPLGVPCKAYPVKGYSATFNIVDAQAAPAIALTDYANKVVYSRLGNQIRMAGAAEITGFSRALDPQRCAGMRRQARALFPSALDFNDVTFWSGLQSFTPSGVPLIGPTRIGNLYLNTGHGALGWTMAAGSGRALADLIAGKKPEPDFPFLG